MRTIQHGPVPEALAEEFSAQPSPQNPTQAWENFEGKTDVRAALLPLQKQRCAYCERMIPTEHAPIEHIRPKERFREQTFQYSNLVLNCDTLGTCTSHKRNDWDESFIPPTDKRCQTFFFYNRDGTVSPAMGLPDIDLAAVTITVRFVNLNHPRLVTEREEILSRIEAVCVDLSDEPEALRIYLALELDENNKAPFISAKQRYFGNPGEISS